MTEVWMPPEEMDAFAEDIATRLTAMAETVAAMPGMRFAYESSNGDCLVSTGPDLERGGEVLGDAADLFAWLTNLAALVRLLDAEYVAVGPPLPGQRPPGIATVDEAEIAWMFGDWAVKWANMTDIREVVRAGGRDEWYEAVYGTINPQNDPSGLVGGYYGGGGFITGPDGREYPIVIPEVTVDGVTYRANSSAVTEPGDDVPSLSGTDPGWTTMSSHQGVTRVRDDMSPIMKFIVGAGVATNPDLAVPPSISKEDYSQVVVDDDGVPAIRGGHVDKAPGPTNEPPVPAEFDLPQWEFRFDDNGDVVVVDAKHPDPNRAMRRQAARQESPTGSNGWRSHTTGHVASGAVDLVGGTMSGMATVKAINDSAHRGYQVKFQSHPDGRRRAIVRMYRGSGGSPDGPIVVTAVSVDADGDLSHVPVPFRPPSNTVLYSVDGVSEDPLEVDE